MNYCKGTFHGKLPKSIPDGEIYCPICKGKMNFKKEQRKNKIKGILKTMLLGAQLSLLPLLVKSILIKKEIKHPCSRSKI